VEDEALVEERRGLLVLLGHRRHLDEQPVDELEGGAVPEDA